MKVIIPAAGKGTRVRPFTHTKPKPLLPVAGKPAIDHIFDRILPLKPSEVVVITGHLRDPLERYLEQKYGGKVKLTFIEQATPRGSAQAYWLARHAFVEDVLVIYSDTIFDADLSVIADCDCDGIFWAMQVPDPSRFGVLVTNGEGFLTQMVEKPKEFLTDMVNIGVYYHRNTEILLKGLEHALEQLDKTDKEIYHADAFRWMLEHGARIQVLPAEGWFDTGTQEETLLTNTRLLDKYPPKTPAFPGSTIIPPVAIDPSAVIAESTIGPHVTVSAGVRITKSKVSDAIIDQQTVVEECDLRHSIIGQHVEVRDISGSVFLGDHSSVKKH